MVRIRLSLAFLASFFFFNTSFTQEGPTVQWFESRSNGGLCSGTIGLFSNGTYTCESGCEASSHFSFGTWRVKKDSIYFTRVNRGNYPLLMRIDTSTSTDPFITVQVFDSTGVNITSRLLFGIYTKAGVYPMGLDSTETKQTGLIRRDAMITSRSLQHIFQQPLNIPLNGSNVIKIWLNVSSKWNFGIRSDWGYMESVLLKTKTGNLQTIHPAQQDEKGDFVPAVYLRIK